MHCQFLTRAFVEDCRPPGLARTASRKRNDKMGKRNESVRNICEVLFVGRVVMLSLSKFHLASTTGDSILCQAVENHGSNEHLEVFYSIIKSYHERH